MLFIEEEDGQEWKVSLAKELECKQQRDIEDKRGELNDIQRINLGIKKGNEKFKETCNNTSVNQPDGKVISQESEFRVHYADTVPILLVSSKTSP